ncbi:EamA family transporter RarD [Aeromicrobium sp. YIM 150415]|uniref:EamA family transporter RarD n=1 Tax=Aeromicrobium piscarium TaxID=2590901 RepID=A0A554SBD7_9ACTN|nr:EamA family transporter RarD [Aeromicrobium sp. YIM 150415]TSD63656.1 EamA family transporter RarD [Aeromicrobium piscarium]
MALVTQQTRSGLVFGVLAYLGWGLFPLYWPLLEPASPFEVLAHRVVWSLVFCAGLLTLTRRWHSFATLVRDRSQLIWLALASMVIAVNWGSFIWGVNNGYVLEVSLGYFINPLITVLFAVFFLKESLRRQQWIAVGVGAVAVGILTVDLGRPPWIALLVSASFAVYGLIKKRTSLGAVEALTVETTVLFPFALGFLVLLQTRGDLAFGHHGAGNTTLLVLTGVVTAIPLLLFAAAASRLNLSTVGLLQYLVPILHFTLGLTVFGEQMGSARWIGFVLIWIALAIFTLDAWRSHRRSLRRAADGTPVL